MNLTDRMALLKAQAEKIIPRVQEGDAEAMKQAEELAAEIEQTKSAIEQADAFEAKLKGIGAAGKAAPDGGAHARRVRGERAFRPQALRAVRGVARHVRRREGRNRRAGEPGHG